MTDQDYHYHLVAPRDLNDVSDTIANSSHPPISARAGSPLLVGPEGSAADLGDGAAEDVPLGDTGLEDSPLATAPIPASSPETTGFKEATTERKHGNTGSKTSTEEVTRSSESDTKPASSSDKTSDSVAFQMTTTLTTSSSSPSASIVTAVEGEPSPVQFSSLAYLVPVFLLISITIGAVIYRKYRARKRAQVIDRESSERFQSPQQQQPAKRGWRQVEASDNEDEDDDEKVWDHESDQEDMEDSSWKDIQLQESKSRPGLIDVSYGTGRSWLKGARWKSTNKIMNPDSPTQRGGASGPSKTVRLVTRSETMATYKSLALGSSVNDDGESVTESKKGWKDSIKSFAQRIAPPRQAMLERNKSPNKRRNLHSVVVAPPPEPPAWIRPRAVSPDRQVLSPPLQPHLFFSPPTSVTDLTMPMTPMTNTDSEYTYTDTDSYPGSSVVQPASKLPNVPAPGSAPIRKPTIKTATPRKARDVNTDQTPTKNSTPTQASYREQSAIDRTPTRRTKGVTANSSMDATVGTSSQFTSPTSPRKSRKERKEEKARERVNSILQASWSDRALSSPSTDTLGPPTSRPRVLGQVPGLISPGMEQTGIDARLAKLRSIE